jgi:hypothetical protein
MLHCPAFVFDAHELAVMKGRRPEEGEVDCAQHGLRRRQRGRRFGGQHREATAHLGRAFPLRDEGGVLPGLQVRLHFARVAGFHFGAEHDRAEFARFVDVFLVFAFQVGVQFRGAHAGLQQDSCTPASLTPVAVETTSTPPDCSVPPTVTDVGVTATETVGSVAAGAVPAAIRLTANATTVLASNSCERVVPRSGVRRIRLK